MKYCISPSILSVDVKNINRDVSILESAGIKYVHIDMMDGYFVPAINIYNEDIINSISELKKDIHLMVKDPENFIDEHLSSVEAEFITFHYEAFDENDKYKISTTIEHIARYYQTKVGLAIKPDTPVSEIRVYLGRVDLVLVMSVEPGKGGQKFMNSALDKIKELDKLRKNHGYTYLIEVDGGVNDKNISFCKDAGADLFVVGSYIFSGKGTIKENIERLNL